MTAVRKWLSDHKQALRRWIIVGLLILLLGVPSLINTKSTSSAYDPKSTEPNGTKAFAMLMQQAGSDFSVGSRGSTGTAILLDDTLSNDEAQRLEAWVQSGGTLVVADVYSSLVGSHAASPNTTQPEVLKPQCNAPYATGVGSIRPNTKANYTLFNKDDATNVVCFPYKNGYFLSQHTVGQGSVIDVGSPDIFTNQDLANYDNAVLVTNLMRPGTGKNIVWLRTSDVAAASGASGGGASLWSLMPERVREALVQLMIAGVILALWRSRRLGQPVDEEQVAKIPASQLVIATGRMLETANQSADAAAIMRNDVKLTFTRLVGVDRNVSDSTLVDILHQRTHIPVDRLEAVLFSMPTNDNAQLIALAQQLEYLYMEVSRVR